MGTDDDPRENVNVRLRRSNLQKIDALAKDRDLTRADVLRELLSLGMSAYEERHRPARPAPKHR
jgi:hypothetical protein